MDVSLHFALVLAANAESCTRCTDFY